jgi:hypothetical protein
MVQKQLNSNDSLPISDATYLLGVSKSGYYKWLRKSCSDSGSIQAEMEIRDELQKIAIEFPR